jgi:hypothetical protein
MASGRRLICLRRMTPPALRATSPYEWGGKAFIDQRRNNSSATAATG